MTTYSGMCLENGRRILQQTKMKLLLKRQPQKRLSKTKLNKPQKYIYPLLEGKIIKKNTVQFVLDVYTPNELFILFAKENLNLLLKCVQSFTHAYSTIGLLENRVS